MIWNKADEIIGIAMRWKGEYKFYLSDLILALVNPKWKPICLFSAGIIESNYDASSIHQAFLDRTFGRFSNVYVKIALP